MVAVTGIAGVSKEATRGKLFLNLGVISGLAPAMLALAPNMTTALLAAALMGATQAGFMTLHAHHDTIRYRRRHSRQGGARCTRCISAA